MIKCKDVPFPVCPYCGFIYKNEIYQLGIEKYKDTNVDCDNCGKTFVAWSESKMVYFSEKIGNDQ